MALFLAVALPISDRAFACVLCAGNQFLATIRECAVILHCVRCFEDTDIVHVENTVDPIRDIVCYVMLC